MTCEADDLTHTRVFPDNNLIFRVPMSTDYLVGVFAPGKVTHLAAGIDFVDWLPSESVPEFYASIGCPAARSKRSMLMWRPRNRFDSSSMFSKFVQWLLVKFVPNKELIVVSTRRKLTILAVPLQTTNFLLVP